MSPDTAKMFGGWGSHHLLPASSSCIHKYEKTPQDPKQVINAASNWKKEWQVCLGTYIGKPLFAHYI